MKRERWSDWNDWRLGGIASGHTSHPCHDGQFEVTRYGYRPLSVSALFSAPWTEWEADYAPPPREGVCCQWVEVGNEQMQTCREDRRSNKCYAQN